MALLRNSKTGGWFEIPDEEVDINRIMNKKIRNQVLDKRDGITTIELAINGKDKTMQKIITDNNNLTIGSVTYLVEKGNYSVYRIDVNELYRKRGIATKLMKSVQREAGNKDINFGTLTSDGEKLISKIATINKIEDGLLGSKVYIGKINL